MRCDESPGSLNQISARRWWCPKNDDGDVDDNADENDDGDDEDDEEHMGSSMAERMTSTEAGSSATEHRVKDIEEIPERQCSAPASQSHATENDSAVAHHILSPCASEVSLARDHITCAYEAEWNPVLPPTSATRHFDRSGREWIYLSDDCWFFCDAPGLAWKQFVCVQNGLTKLWWWNSHSNQWCWH